MVEDAPEVIDEYSHMPYISLREDPVKTAGVVSTGVVNQDNN